MVIAVVVMVMMLPPNAGTTPVLTSGQPTHGYYLRLINEAGEAQGGKNSTSCCNRKCQSWSGQAPGFRSLFFPTGLWALLSLSKNAQENPPRMSNCGRRAACLA